MICEYESNVSKLASLIEADGIKVISFEPASEDTDAEINLGIPDRDINIQVCPYLPEEGYMVAEVEGSGRDMCLKYLRSFPLNKKGFSSMISFIKELK